MTSLVLGACEKSDNVAQLREQATAIGKTYGPRAADLAKRKQAILDRGKNVPGNLPDVPEIVRLINEAGDKIKEMQGITAAIDKQADDAAKSGKREELQRLIDESHEKLDIDDTVASEDMTRIESWLWQFEQGRTTPVAPPKENPVPPPNETGQPPPAEAQGSGAGSASDKTEKAAQKAAGEKADKGAKKAPPAEKSDKKAGGEKKAAGSAAK